MFSIAFGVSVSYPTIMDSVKGKVVLLTGALGGLGTCFVRELLKNEAKGIALVDINDKTANSFQKEMCQAYGDGKTVFIKADLTDPAQIEMAFEKAIGHFKQLDIVINNAGLFSETDFLKCVQANFVATSYSTYLALMKYLEPNRISSEAIIINISSTAGLYHFPSLPTYSACKHGIVSLGRLFGDEIHYNAKKIRIMTICPGATNTAILKQLDERPDYLKPFATDMVKKHECFQKPENVATELMYIIRNGKTGSVWVVKDDKPAEEVDWTAIDNHFEKYGS